MNLPKALEWVRTTGVNTREHEGNRSIYWLYEYVRRAERQLPVSPDVFDEQIELKTVTNGSDKQILKDKFKKTFVAVMKPAKKLLLSDIPGPSSTEWRLFLQDTLRCCPRLQHIDLSCNETIADATLEPFAPLDNTLEYLNVGNCVGFAGTLDALKDLRKLRQLYLYGCVALEGSVEPLGAVRELVTLNVEACFGLQGGVHVLAALPKLKVLNISDTQLDTDGFVGACKVGRWGNELTPLWRAANNGLVHTARRLLEGTADRRGVEVDRTTKNEGTTPLIQAAAQRFPEVAEILLQHRADANLARNDGVTPLYFAAFNGSVEVAQLLLVHGAEVNQTNNKNKSTPLHAAAEFGHVTVVHLLLKNRADATLKDLWNDNPLASARRAGHHEVATLLVQTERE